ncbi:uncharacterized protein LOC111059814 isoform X3 [Nilaparvata lugens]|uniref:uncharacterized protein LOC111059814 isoform X3 n=1 Tax=Nilaparvata lugens TaxID=108931 RepID=UPI000B9978B5|nr:uncharacterized protein LOC111059814 isoform X3 [Nilaparvata lugens]
MELLNKKSSQIYVHIVMDIGYPMSVDNLQNILNVRSNIQITMEEYEDMIHLALKSAVEEYSSKQKMGSRGRIDKKSFVEILIITRKYAHNFNLCINRISENLKGNQLKRIQILKLIDNDSEMEGEGEVTENEKSSLVNNVTVKLDSEIDDHIKRCIFDSYSSLGEMTLYMPNKTIYCELKFYNLSSKTCKFDLNKVQEMEVIHRIAADGLCESHTFGDPIRVTSSSNMDNWMQQAVNSQTFEALCLHLNENDEYLIVRLKNAVSLSTFDYFALRPGTDCMLMKSVCSGEMVVPEPLNRVSLCAGVAEERSIHEYAEVAVALRHVTRAEEYLPNHFLSGLLPSLLSQPVASAKHGSALIKRNQYNKLEIQVKKTSFHQVECESPRTISQDENGVPTPKKRMLLPLNDHPALLNPDVHEVD